MAKKPKGKMGFWRRLAKKRYDGTTEARNGRLLRNIVMKMRGPEYPTRQVISLLKRTGVSTQKFDEMKSDPCKAVLVCFD